MHARSLSRNTITLLIGNLVGAGLSFLLAALIGRSYGESGLGIYAASLAWIFPLALLVEFGTNTALIRDTSTDYAKQDAYLLAITAIKLRIGIPIMLLLWAFAEIIVNAPTVAEGIRLSAPLVLTLPLFSGFSAIFRSRQQMLPVTALTVGMLIVQVTLTLAVILGGYSVRWTLVVNTVTSAGQLFAAYIIYQRYFVYRNPSVSDKTNPIPTDSLAITNRSRPFAIAGVLAAVQIRLPLILLGQIGIPAQAGLFSAAQRFLDAGKIPAQAYFDALFPRLSSLKPEEIPQAQRLTLRFVAVVGAVFALGIIFAGPWALHVVYGPSFDAALLPLRIGAFVLLVSLLKNGLTLIRYAQGREQAANLVTAISILVAFPCGLWLIPQYGATGAMLTALMTETSAFVLLWRI